MRSFNTKNDNNIYDDRFFCYLTTMFQLQTFYSVEEDWKITISGAAAVTCSVRRRGNGLKDIKIPVEA